MTTITLACITPGCHRPAQLHKGGRCTTCHWHARARYELPRIVNLTLDQYERRKKQILNS